MTPSTARRPEILAPAGSIESFAAALASGADAVYLGLSEGFNARARSTAFTLETLPELVRRAHLANVKVYLTMNTLVFENELAELEHILRRVIAAGVDALIVQDPATALLARRLSPTLRLHASTQMTISSSEGAQFAATLGMERVVLPRELSVEEIQRFTRESSLEAEVFVHGALCMAWSGQCLTSEAFSERSANRGQCSQACRMPYEAIVDGERRDFGDLRYLLSPEDLAAHEMLPDLMNAGVHSLKIEGRYKGPAYVSTAVDSWRNWREAVLRGVTDADREQLQRDIERTQLTFSRGGSVGFLRGDNHQALVKATTPKHRGLDVGTVREVHPRRVVVTLSDEEAAQRWLRPGVGLKFELVGRSAKEHDPDNAPGGPLFGVRYLTGNGRSELPSKLCAELRFGEPGPDLSRVRVGDWVRLTGDPELTRDAERRIQTPVTGRIAVQLRVAGRRGEPLRLTASAHCVGQALKTEIVSAASLAAAKSGSGLDEALLRDKLGALGGTPFHLSELDLEHLGPGLYLPVSELKQLRRRMVEAIEKQLPVDSSNAALEASTHAALDADSTHSSRLTEELRSARPVSEATGPTQLIPLCRTEEQLEALIASGLGNGDEVELDWMEMVGLGRAVERARAAGLHVTLATVRVQKPGEEAFDRRIEKLAPDAILVRHWGALMHFSRRGNEGPSSHPASLALHGDFSLNVTNSLTAHHLLSLGLTSVTASHDLNKAQLLDLLSNTPRGRVAVTLHHHIATFHNSHCVYAHLLSSGADYRTCGRPCEKHRLALRDYAGNDHPVVVDVSCRNTVFHGAAQSAAPLVPQLLERGVRRFRVEFVWEDGAQVKQTWLAYQRLLRGELDAKAALEAAAVHERYGVTAPLRLRKR
jgi:putative protease